MSGSILDGLGGLLGSLYGGGQPWCHGHGGGHGGGGGGGSGGSGGGSIGSGGTGNLTTAGTVLTIVTPNVLENVFGGFDTVTVTAKDVGVADYSNNDTISFTAAGSGTYTDYGTGETLTLTGSLKDTVALTNTGSVDVFGYNSSSDTIDFSKLLAASAYGKGDSNVKDFIQFDQVASTTNPGGIDTTVLFNASGNFSGSAVTVADFHNETLFFKPLPGHITHG